MTAPKKKQNAETKESATEYVRRYIRFQAQRDEDSIRDGRGIREGLRREELAGCFKRFYDGGIPISATSLAQLAMARKGGAVKLSSITDDDLDDLLEFVARCQWRIEVTRDFWFYYARALRDECLDEPEPSEREKHILEESRKIRERIPFGKGLILLGIPDRPRKTKVSPETARTEWFFPHFRQDFIETSKVEHLGGDLQCGREPQPLETWQQPTEEEIQTAYRKQIEWGWMDGYELLRFLPKIAEAKKTLQTKVNRENAKGRAKKRRD